MIEPNYYLKDKNIQSKTAIIMVVRWAGNTLKVSTGKSIPVEFWNPEKQIVRRLNATENFTVINARLASWKEDTQKAFAELEKNLGRVPTVSELKEEILEIMGKSSDKSTVEDISFLGLFKKFIAASEDGSRLTSTGKRFDRRSIQKYNTVFGSLEKFGKTYHLDFETIDKNFYTKYVKALNTPEYKLNENGEKVEVKKAFSLNNVGKYIQVIKTFLSWATENGFNRNMYFQSKSFKAHKVAGFSIYLTETEIDELYALDLTSTPHLERVRDLFIVGCWTGLRFSDFTAIKPENIQGNFLHIKTFKTGERVIIPIHPMVKEILAKYSDKYLNSLPPAIANQKMNSYLKDIAKIAPSLNVEVETEGIKGGLKVQGTQKKHELVTTHTARRSFATNVYKSGFPAISLMKITGHRTEKAFLLYIKVTPEENAQKLAEHWAKPLMKVS